MAEPSRTASNLNQTAYTGAPSLEESVLTGKAPLPELPETSVVAAPGRSSNAQLNRSAEALGRGMGNAVAGVKNLPRQFDRLRSRIHLVRPEPPCGSLVGAGSDVAGDWRDVVESGASEAVRTARRYRSVIADRASQRLQELRWRAERRLYALQRDLRHRADKVRRTSSEAPLQFIAGCAGAAFVVGVTLRIWRSNHDE